MGTGTPRGRLHRKVGPAGAAAGRLPSDAQLLPSQLGCARARARGGATQVWAGSGARDQNVQKETGNLTVEGPADATITRRVKVDVTGDRPRC